MRKSPLTYFHGKKITMLGLGLLGRGINVAKFLVQNGASLTITDLKSKEQLATSLKALDKYKNKITYVLGQHRLENFRDVDMVIKAAGVPLDSPFVEEARKNKIPIEMDASLFAKHTPKGVTLIGITGTRGKSTTTGLIAFILKSAGKRVFLGGNVRGLATLPLLKKVKTSDFVVLELDSWQLQGFGEAKISPKIAVFTNLMPDHMNYYKNNMDRYFADKANIFLHQKNNDILIAGKEISEAIGKKHTLQGKMIVKGAEDLPANIELKILGSHNRANASLALEAARFLGIPENIIKNSLKKFPGVEGRLQYVGEKKGVRVYNDNNATTADATAAGLASLGENKNVVLITGGADKGLSMQRLIDGIEKHCRAVILLSGTGTEKVKLDILALKNIEVFEYERLEECFKKASDIAQKGDVILFSPAFASFSKYFQNEYERNDQFAALVKKWLKQ